MKSIITLFRIADCLSWVSRLTLLDLGLSSGLLKWSSFTCRATRARGASWLVIAWPQRVGVGRSTPTSQGEGAEAPGSDPPGAHTACLSFDWSCGCVWAKSLQLCLILGDPMDCSPPALCPRDFPGKNTGVGCHALLQGIFLAQGSNPSLWCRLH